MPPKTSKQKAALQRWIRRRGVPIPVALPVAAGLPLAPLVATNDEEAVMNGSGLHSLRNGGRRIAKVLLSEKERAKLFKSKREYMQKKRNDVRDNNAAIALRKKKKRHENSQKILGGRLIERRTSLCREWSTFLCSPWLPSKALSRVLRGKSVNNSSDSLFNTK